MQHVPFKSGCYGILLLKGVNSRKLIMKGRNEDWTDNFDEFRQANLHANACKRYATMTKCYRTTVKSEIIVGNDDRRDYYVNFFYLFIFICLFAPTIL